MKTYLQQRHGRVDRETIRQGKAAGWARGLSLDAEPGPDFDLRGFVGLFILPGLYGLGQRVDENGMSAKLFYIGHGAVGLDRDHHAGGAFNAILSIPIPRSETVPARTES